MNKKIKTHTYYNDDVMSTITEITVTKIFSNSRDVYCLINDRPLSVIRVTKKKKKKGLYKFRIIPLYKNSEHPEKVFDNLTLTQVNDNISEYYKQVFLLDKEQQNQDNRNRINELLQHKTDFPDLNETWYEKYNDTVSQLGIFYGLGLLLLGGLASKYIFTSIIIFVIILSIFVIYHISMWAFKKINRYIKSRKFRQPRKFIDPNNLPENVILPPEIHLPILDMRDASQDEKDRMLKETVHIYNEGDSKSLKVLEKRIRNASRKVRTEIDKEKIKKEKDNVKGRQWSD